MNPIRRLYLRLSAFAWTAFALVCIGMAVLVGIASLLLPYADRYRPEVEDWLTQRIGRPVSIAHIEAEWAAFGPRIYVEGLAIGAPGDPDRLEIEMATIGLDFYSWLRPAGRGMQTLRFSVEEIELLHNSDGGWQLGGFAQSAGQVRSSGNPARWLAGQAAVGFAISRVTVRDERSGRTIRLPGGSLDFTDHGDHQHVIAKLGNSDIGELRLILERDDDHALSAYIEGQDLVLDAWTRDWMPELRIERGQLNMRLWADLGTQMAARGSVQIDDLTLVAGPRNPVQGSYRLDRATSNVNAWSEPEERGLQLRDLQLHRGPTRHMVGSMGLARRDGRWRVVAESLDLGELAAPAALVPLLPPSWRSMLAGADPRGLISHMDLSIDDQARPVRANGHLELADAAWLALGRWPGVSGLFTRLNFSGTQAGGNLLLDDARLDFPQLLRQPLDLLDLDSRLRLDWGEAEPVIDIHQARLHHAGATVSGRGKLVLNGARPFADLALHVSRAQVAQAPAYLPYPYMSEKLLSWLDRALVGGMVDNGSVVLFGDLDDWPFDGGEGRLLARAEVSDATLAYQPDWPTIEQIEATLEFDSQGLAGQLLSATTQGIRLSESEVDIASYRQPILAAGIKGAASGNELLDFLRQTPLREHYSQHTDGLSIEGPTDVWVHLETPLREGTDETRVTGHAWLEEAAVADTQWHIAFEQTSGRVDFNQDGFEAVGLRTRFRGTPARLTVRTGTFVQTPGLIAEGRLDATSSPALLLQNYPMFAPLTEQIAGIAPWQARILVPEAGGEPQFELSSQLAAADLGLPAPFASSGDQALPLWLSFDLAPPIEQLRLSVGELASLNLRSDPATGLWAARLHFGAGVPDSPTTPGLSISGQIEQMDADAWLALQAAMRWEAAAGSDQPRLSDANVQIDTLTLAGRRFDQVRLRARQEDRYWYIDADAQQFEGRLRLPVQPGENRLLLAEFERLHWPEADGRTPEPNIDPRRYPPLDFYAADLSVGDALLGNVRFESFPTQSGMRIENFETDSAQLRVSANGVWLASGSSRFEATLLSQDLGAALEQFGFSGMIAGGQLVARLEAGWPGAPVEFELSELDGIIDLSIERGQITEVDPGAGRIFGLLSVQSLPRRLMLDFSDLFKSGLTFDRISGHFRLEDGQAQTRDLSIHGPTATVFIQGRTGLAERDYDQLVTVVPKVGNALPLVGAIAGGGVGAAAFLLLQNVFSNQIERMTRYRYRVTGPWSDPEIELIGANESELGIEQLR